MAYKTKCRLCGAPTEPDKHGYCSLHAAIGLAPHVVRQSVLPGIKVQVVPPINGWHEGARVDYIQAGFLFTVRVYRGGFCTIIRAIKTTGG